MKIFILFCLLPLAGISQITTAEKLPPTVTVGKIAPLGAFIAGLSYFVYPENGTDTTYMFRFDDKRFTQLKRTETVSFSAEGNTLEQFYTILKSAFLDSNKDNKDYILSFKLGKDDVMVTPSKYLGATLVRFSKGLSYTVLTEKQVDKIFGKN